MNKDIEEEIKRKYGFLPLNAGVLHVTAVWQSPEGNYVTLKINENTPKSEEDVFALNLARARADVIITSGKILREEPDLTHNLWHNEKALLQWRRTVLKKKSPPYSIILTSGRDLDFTHPIFSQNNWTTPIVYVPYDFPSELEAKAKRVGVQLRVHPKNGKITLQEVIEFAESNLDARTISIEAGPSISAELYQDPIIVNELMLSIYKSQHLNKDFEGGKFISPKDIERIFSSPKASYSKDSWEFKRYTRKQPHL